MHMHMYMSMYMPAVHVAVRVAGPTIHMAVLETFKLRNDTPSSSSSSSSSSRQPAMPLRLIANAAGSLLPHAAREMRATYGDATAILPSYGMTECMPISSPPIDYRAPSLTRV